MKQSWFRSTLLKLLGKGVTFAAGGSTPGGGFGYQGWGALGGLLPGSQYDYKREAGLLWDNGIVLACLKWMCRTFPEAPVCLEKRTQGSNWEQVGEHPLIDLLNTPNGHWDAGMLWSATLLSLAVAGNSYWLKVRGGTGKVVELWWLPHWTVEPCWPIDGSAYISHYEYRPQSQTIRIPIEDIVHLRDGIDPANFRKGLSPLSAILREVCTDNEAATFAAAILRNMGVPGSIIMPAEAGYEMSPEQRDLLRALWKEKFGGDRRGEPLVLSSPMKIDTPGFSPEQLVLDKVRRIPEERITAALGIPAIVVGMGAGLERSTYANFKEAREAAYESCLIPMQRSLGSQLTRQLLPELDKSKGLRVAWDLTQVRVLDEPTNGIYDRVTTAYQGGWMRRSEARQATGWPAEAGDEVYITDVTGGATETTLDKPAKTPVKALAKALPAGDQAADDTNDADDTDDDEPADAQEAKKRSDALLLLLLRFRGQAEQAATALDSAWGAAAASPEDGAQLRGEAARAFVGALRSAMVEGVTAAAEAGSGAAGRTADKESAAKAAERELQRQDPFLSGFEADIATGRYTTDSGGLQTGAIVARARVYGGALRAGESRAYVEAAAEVAESASAAEPLFEWVLGAAEHCADCPALAAGGPYTAASLPTYPGAGDTECLGHCRCMLVSVTP